MKVKKATRIFAAFMAILMLLYMAAPAMGHGCIQTVKAATAVSSGPNVKTTLEDGATVRGSLKNFDVWATDADGKKLPVDDLTVTLNGNTVKPSWDDSSKTSYMLHLTQGDNTVVVTARDASGTATAAYALHHPAANPGDVIGQATICVEAFTISSGYIVEPVKVDIHEGERASQVVDRVLTQDGFKYRYTGRLTSDFYLSAILNGGSALTYGQGGCTDPDKGQKLNLHPALPDLLTPYVTKFKPAKYQSDKLGEFDFDQGSGWMYCVNNNFPNVGLSDYYLTDGDVMRIQFTLWYGKDIGGYGALGGGGDAGYFPIANKDGLTAFVADVNSSQDKAALLAKENIQSAYNNALSLLSDLSASQNDVDTVYSKLEDAMADQTAADTVTAEIAALPVNIACADASAIQAARAAYDALTDAQKALVTNLDVLKTDEAAIAKLQAQVSSTAGSSQQAQVLDSSSTTETLGSAQQSNGGLSSVGSLSSVRNPDTGNTQAEALGVLLIVTVSALLLLSMPRRRSRSKKSQK